MTALAFALSDSTESSGAPMGGVKLSRHRAGLTVFTVAEKTVAPVRFASSAGKVVVEARRPKNGVQTP